VTCIHLLLSVYIEYYNINPVFSFLKMCINFFGTPGISLGSCVKVKVKVEVEGKVQQAVKALRGVEVTFVALLFL
jgi:hypothetical protein